MGVIEIYYYAFDQSLILTFTNSFFTQKNKETKMNANCMLDTELHYIPNKTQASNVG